MRKIKKLGLTTYSKTLLFIVFSVLIALFTSCSSKNKLLNFKPINIAKVYKFNTLNNSAPFFDTHNLWVLNSFDSLEKTNSTFKIDTSDVANGTMDFKLQFAINNRNLETTNYYEYSALIIPKNPFLFKEAYYPVFGYQSDKK